MKYRTHTFHGQLRPSGIWRREAACWYGLPETGSNHEPAII